MVQSLVLASPPPYPYLVPVTGAFCVILKLALSHFLTIMLAVVSGRMEQMTDVNLMQSANWKHLQPGGEPCREARSAAGWAGLQGAARGPPRRGPLQKPSGPSGRRKVSFL